MPKTLLHSITRVCIGLELLDVFRCSQHTTIVDYEKALKQRNRCLTVVVVKLIQNLGNSCSILALHIILLTPQ